MRKTIRYKVCKDIVIKSANDAGKFIGNTFRRLDHEESWILLLDHANHPIVKRQITVGTLTSVLIDVRRIVKDALMFNATGIILMHNHPCNDLYPSNADLKETERLHEACGLFDISLVDHLIIGDDRYYSFNDEKEYSL